MLNAAATMAVELARSTSAPNNFFLSRARGLKAYPKSLEFAGQRVGTLRCSLISES
jgi:hypothetical protein